MQPIQLVLRLPRRRLSLKQIDRYEITVSEPLSEYDLFTLGPKGNSAILDLLMLPKNAISVNGNDYYSQGTLKDSKPVITYFLPADFNYQYINYISEELLKEHPNTSFVINHNPSTQGYRLFNDAYDILIKKDLCVLYNINNNSACSYTDLSQLITDLDKEYDAFDIEYIHSNTTATIAHRMNDNPYSYYRLQNKRPTSLSITFNKVDLITACITAGFSMPINTSTIAMSTSFHRMLNEFSNYKIKSFTALSTVDKNKSVDTRLEKLYLASETEIEKNIMSLGLDIESLYNDNSYQDHPANVRNEVQDTLETVPRPIVKLSELSFDNCLSNRYSLFDKIILSLPELTELKSTNNTPYTEFARKVLTLHLYGSYLLGFVNYVTENSNGYKTPIQQYMCRHLILADEETIAFNRITLRIPKNKVNTLISKIDNIKMNDRIFKHNPKVTQKPAATNQPNLLQNIANLDTTKDINTLMKELSNILTVP